MLEKWVIKRGRTKEEKKKEKEVKKKETIRRMEEKRKPIRPLSKKRMKEFGQYQKVKKQYLEAYPECGAKISPHCSYAAVDIHHRQRRRTEEQRMDTQHWVGTCRSCHLFLHAHEDKARELGLIENGLK